MPHLKRTATGVLGGLAGLVGLSAVAGVLVTATVTPAIAVTGYAATSALDTFDNMPSYLEIDKLMLPTEIYRKVGDQDVMMAQFYDQDRIPVTFDEIAPVMKDAIISSEDKSFFTHGGVNLLGTVSALLEGSGRGGSSITQQYVKNILQQNCELTAVDDDAVAACYAETTVSKGSAGYQRKLQEMRYAIQLEKQYSKEDILTGYLNIAHFGGITYGIGAAAQHYFGVSAADLTVAQAATIAGMVQEPNTFRIDKPDGSAKDKAGNLINSEADGYSLTLERRDYVLYRMLEDGKISQAEYDEAKASPITPNVQTRQQGCQTATGAEFFCEYVRSIILYDKAFDESLGDSIEARSAALRRGGLKIYTTLDADLQQAALDAIAIVPANSDYFNLGASGVQVEVGTGRILSMVQNRPYSIDDAGNDGQTTQVNYNTSGHSAGSTYKLFSLLNWMEQGHSVNEIVNGRVGVKNVINCDGQTQQVRADNYNGVANFLNNPGYNGTVYNFTRDSLNSGYLAMAEKISVCSTNELAMRLGVQTTPGRTLVQENFGYNVLGNQAVTPLSMAEAYATVASNGILCQAKAIDRAVDSEGNDITPETTCKRELSEAVASTAAYTLQGVMAPGGTGTGAVVGDGVPIFGKTGIHEYYHTWMDGASTKVATVVWVGNVIGTAKIDKYWANGYPYSRIRNAIWPKMQGAANAKFGGDAFPAPDEALTKRIMATLPSVIGMTTDRATRTLEAAGFSVIVGDAVDAAESAGTIVRQDPGAGRVAAGTVVTISPSNGNGTSVPGVSGKPDAALSTLRSAGFTDLSTSCTADDDAPEDGVVTGTDPAAGSVVSRSTHITVQYRAQSCD